MGGGHPLTRGQESPHPLRGLSLMHLAQFWEDGVSASDKWPSPNRQRLAICEGGTTVRLRKLGENQYPPKGFVPPGS